MKRSPPGPVSLPIATHGARRNGGGERKGRSRQRSSRERTNAGLSKGVQVGEADILSFEEALHASEHRYRTLFDLVPAAVYTCDAEGLILEFNQRAIVLWGRTPKTRDPSDRYCGSFRIYYLDGRPMPHRSSPMARVLRGEKVPVKDREIVVECRDGTRRNVAVNPTVLRDKRGKIIGAINCLYDITEQKCAEAELRKSKGELDLIIGHTPFMLTRCSRDLRYLYVSREYAKVAGAKAAAIVGKSIVDILGKEGLAVIRPYIERVLSGHRAEYETFVPFKSGGRFLHATYLPERNEKGEVVGWIASLVDVGERKKAEQSLAEAVRQQSALYEFVRRRHEGKSLSEIYSAALDAIRTTLHCSRASILLFDNRRVMRFVAWRGLSASYRKKVNGYNPWQHKETRPKPIWIEDIKRIEIPVELRSTIFSEGIQATAFVPLISDGKLIGRFTIYYDEPHLFTDEEITVSLTIAGQLALAIARKRAERALVESERLYRAFFSQTEVGMARSDLRGRVVSANKKLCEIVGYSEAELIGKRISDLTERRYRSRTAKLFRELVGKQSAYHLEKRYVRKDGSLVWVQVTASPLRDTKGKMYAAVAVIRDITDRKEAQAALEEAKELLEKRVQERTFELVAANEKLRNEIARRKGLEGEILEISEREQRQIGQELHDSLCQHLTAIAFMARSMAMRLKNHREIEVANVEKIAQLINEGVTEARTIARGLHPVEMNPDGFTAALHSLLQQRSQLPYRLEIDEEVSIPDPSVALHLYRIASEAVINANKHARARELMVRMRGLRKHIELSVSDDGVGIDQNRRKGSGMGFHVMEYRARSIGARLEVRPLKPHGTLVACYLPRQ